jgi:leucyl/phenylalanyl-tRNA--protein transferase
MGQLFALNDDSAFPDIDCALDEPNGLLAVGGDLSTNRLIAAYKNGIFPWYQDNQPILWWSPNPRCVIDPSTFKASKTLAKKIARGEFDIGIDQNFTNVIDACSHRDQNEATWITRDMQDAYIKLYEKGIAHSIECYKDGELVGGLYGLSIGSLFFGESMFHRVTDASKVAFAQLMRLMRRQGSPMVDCQLSNPHLLSLGAIEIPRARFKTILRQHINDSPIDWQQLANT